MQSAVSARQFCGCLKAIYLCGDSWVGGARDALRIYSQGFPEMYSALQGRLTLSGTGLDSWRP